MNAVAESMGMELEGEIGLLGLQDFRTKALQNLQLKTVIKVRFHNVCISSISHEGMIVMHVHN